MEDTIHQLSFQFIKTLSGSLSQFGNQNPVLGELPLQILLHIVSCTSALRDILESQPKGAQSEVSTQVYSPFLNGFVGSLGKYLLDSLSFEPKASMSPSLVAYQVAFRHLIRLFPELAKRRHKTTGKLLLHHIVLKCRPATIVETMRATLALAPDSAKTPDSSGALPLHWATKNESFPADCVDILVQSYPQCIQALDQKGCLPLHWAVTASPTPLEVIRRLVKLYPKSSSVASSTGNLALHYAVSHDSPSVEVVNLLLAVFPDAVRHKNTLGELPVHRLMSRISPDMTVLNTLVQKFPEGLLVTNAHGHTPLHVALDHHLPSPVLTYLIKQGPRAAELGDSDGYYPLHMALDTPHPDPQIVEMLYNAHPAAATIPTHDDLLPFHLLLTLSPSPPIPLLAMLLTPLPHIVSLEVTEWIPRGEEGVSGVMLAGESWSGEWVERKWTPLQKAHERNLGPEVITFLQDVTANPALLTTKYHPSTGMASGGMHIAPPAKFVMNEPTIASAGTGVNSMAPPISFTAFNGGNNTFTNTAPVPSKTYEEVVPFDSQVLPSASPSAFLSATSPLPSMDAPPFTPTTTLRPTTAGGESSELNMGGTGGIGTPVMVGNFVTSNNTAAANNTSSHNPADGMGSRGVSSGGLVGPAPPPQGPIPPSLLQAAENNALRLSRAQYDFLKGGNKKISKKKKKNHASDGGGGVSEGEDVPGGSYTNSSNNNININNNNSNANAGGGVGEVSVVKKVPSSNQVGSAEMRASTSPIAFSQPPQSNLQAPPSTASPNLDDPSNSPPRSKKVSPNPQNFIKRGTKIVVEGSSGGDGGSSVGGGSVGGGSVGVRSGMTSGAVVVSPPGGSVQGSVGRSYATNNTVEIMKSLGGKVKVHPSGVTTTNVNAQDMV